MVTKPTLPFNPEEIKPSTVKAVDGLGNNVRDYIFNPAENKFEHKDDLDIRDEWWNIKPEPEEEI